MNDRSSIMRQAQQDAEYRAVYAAWLEALPREERRKLERLGLGRPLHDDYTVGGRGTEDVASYASSGWPKDDDDDDTAESEACTPPAPEKIGSMPPVATADENTERSHDLLRRLLGEVITQSKVGLSLDCLALVTGLVYDGDSMTEIARRHDVTRAAVSKRCIELTFALKLKPSRAMRTMLARENSRQTRNHLMRFLLP